MAGYESKLERAAAVVLEEGEMILAAARGMTMGTTRSAAGGAAGSVALGAAGTLIGAQAGSAGGAESREGLRATGLPDLPSQIAVALTDRRLLLFRRSAITGRARSLVAQVPRERITSITGDTSLSAFKPDHLTVVLDDATRLTFEIVRRDGFAPIAAAFREA